MSEGTGEEEAKQGLQAETASPGEHQFVTEGVFRKLRFYSDFKASEWFLLNAIREV